MSRSCGRERSSEGVAQSAVDRVYPRQTDWQPRGGNTASDEQRQCATSVQTARCLWASHVSTSTSSQAIEEDTIGENERRVKQTLRNT